MQYGMTLDSSSPVIALSIFDQSDSKNYSRQDIARMLVAVRDPNTNLTHPNVISVPTQRIPQSLFEDILRTALVKSQLGSTTFYEGPEISNKQEDGHHPVIFAVESLLSKKLELSKELETGRLNFTAALKAVKLGKSYHTNQEGVEKEEHISMANIVVNLFEGGDFIPARTMSYSCVSWVEPIRFLEIVETKDPTLLSTELDPIDYCVHGLCVLTSYEIIKQMLQTEGA